MWGRGPLRPGLPLCVCGWGGGLERVWLCHASQHMSEQEIQRGPYAAVLNRASHGAFKGPRSVKLEAGKHGGQGAGLRWRPGSPSRGSFEVRIGEAYIEHP